MSSKNPVEYNEGISDISTLGLKYEVFLSFRGPDTRDSFTDHLYFRLKNVGVRVFRDDEELRKGEKIEPELLKGISESKIVIPIFSKGYAASKWCLKELAHVVECMKSTKLKVLPIFYDVTPSEVREQTRGYGKAFELHEKCYHKDTIVNWRRALTEVGELKGWTVWSATHHRPEGELVEEITNEILHELKKANLVVTSYLVGLEHHVEELLKTLTVDNNGVKIVAIHGMGGTGKTTLGKFIYNHLWPRFENHCFLADIRETIRSKGMEFLQESLISNILNVKSMDFSNVDERIKFINERFCNKDVLLLLDDIDEISHVKGLIARRDQFGYGSRIIITTRNKGIFDQFEVDRSYELSGLDFHHALQLFSRHAFRNEKPLEEYVALSQRIIKIAGGLPLALEVFGSLLHGKSKDKWFSTVERLEKVLHEEVSAKLRISFEALNEQQKQMFLDIACFFIGQNKSIVIHFWDRSEFPEEAIEVLQQMSLIKIKEDHSLWMHDQLRDLGREIVRLENEEPERRSRLWNVEEGTKVLMQKMASDNVRGINFNLQRNTKYSVSNEHFARLPNLRLLHVNEFGYKWHKRINLSNLLRKSPRIFSKLRWLSWHRFPHKYDTSNFSVVHLVLLDLSYSKIKSNWTGWSRIKMAKNLKILNLTGCEKLVRTPSFSSHLKLERLILRQCFNLVEIDESIRLLEHLVIINLEGCRKLHKLPRVLSCTESLEELDLSYTEIIELPNSIGHLKNLKVLSVGYTRIETLPESIKHLESLTELDLSCTKITELPDTIDDLKNLKVLKVKYTPIRKLPTTIGMLENLITLDASRCYDLHNIPKLPGSLISLEVRCGDIQNADLSNLINLKNLEMITSCSKEYAFKIEDHAPCWIGRLANLESLTLGLRQINSLHADLAKLSQLTKLELFSCVNLESIHMLPPGLKELSIFGCVSLGSLLDLPSGLVILRIENCGSLTLLDLSYLRKLGYLCIWLTPISKLKEIRSCDSLQKLHIYECDLSEFDGLEMLENLITLTIEFCEKLQTLPDLSNLKKLRSLHIAYCPDLVEIPGMLESLDSFHIENCESLERIPIIPNSKTVGWSFCVENCGKIKSSG